MHDSDDNDVPPSEPASGPAQRVSEKLEELRMHAELAAVFEATRKFDARLLPTLPFPLARDLQQTIARIERVRIGQLIPPPSLPAAQPFPEALAESARLLALPREHDLPLNDYHLCQRPGQLLLARWLGPDDVESFFSRLQAHFDAGLAGALDDARNDAWRADSSASAYLSALESATLNLEDKYLRSQVRSARLHALSTQTIDDLNITYLTDAIMETAPEDLLGPLNPLPDDPEPSDLGWYLKLFLLRAAPESSETALFFGFFQKLHEI